MDLKDVFDQIVNRMERAKEKEIRPEITPFPGECTITIPEKEAQYRIRLKEYPNGVTINTQLGGKPQHVCRQQKWEFWVAELAESFSPRSWSWGSSV